jgi:hypothetical protein
MTFSARFTVQDVGDGPRPIDVLAVSEGDAIVANTEGKVRSMELRIVLDEDETTLKEGDVITTSGHFTGIA